MMPPRPRLVHILTDPMSFWLVKGQSALLAGAGYDVHTISAPGARAEQQARTEKAQFHPVPMARRIAPWSDLLSLAALYATLRRLRPRAVIAGTPKAGLLGTIAAWLLDVPVRIYYVHGLPVLTARGPRRLVLRATEWLACTTATHVVCVGHSMRRELIREQLCRPAKAVVLANGSSNGVDTSAFNRRRFPDDVRLDLRARFGIPVDAPVVGFIGRVVREKGIAELYTAWRDLRERCPSAHLLIVGPREATDPVPQEVLDGLASDPRVRLVGSDWNTVPYYLAMDVLCLPSHREGLPNVPLEAASMELPVVAFRVPGVTDAIEHDVTGTLVEPLSADALADALHQYMIDPARRRAHGEAGRRRVAALFGRGLVSAALVDFCRRLATDDGLRDVTPGHQPTHECTETI